MKYKVGTILKHKYSLTPSSATATVIGCNQNKEYTMSWSTGQVNQWPEPSINLYLTVLYNASIFPEELFTL